MLALVLGGVGIALILQGRDYAAQYIGSTAASFIGLGATLVLLLGPVSGPLSDFVERWQQNRREKLDEIKADELDMRASKEWTTFKTWAEQNPLVVERLLLEVDDAQVDDPDRRAWNWERRKTEGSNDLYDLQKLFDWLKAERDFRALGFDRPLHHSKRPNPDGRPASD